ncbi:hypothetical protein LX32DRAFT_207879 [Colletotrichum zoysiae]|uniref:Uncharacterized protein n=1 Tax=Colletotrichum zoysiae TaxID=1216348 RepID=A0AAD9HNI7_9PEZI|nr:hypothetical protein LX32DRAFT_207879 [Colletotrichum zoysiae]
MRAIPTYGYLPTYLPAPTYTSHALLLLRHHAPHRCCWTQPTIPPAYHLALFARPEPSTPASQPFLLHHSSNKAVNPRKSQSQFFHPPTSHHCPVLFLFWFDKRHARHLEPCCESHRPLPRTSWTDSLHPPVCITRSSSYQYLGSQPIDRHYLLLRTLRTFPKTTIPNPAQNKTRRRHFYALPRNPKPFLLPLQPAYARITTTTSTKNPINPSLATTVTNH